MNIKHKYVNKYLLFRTLPYFLFYAALAVLLIVAASSGGKKYELILAISISAICLVSHLLVSVISIWRFLKIIKEQEKEYGTTFDDDKAAVLSRYSPWLILSKNWLIRPGKCAVFKGGISGVGIRFDIGYGYKFGYYEVNLKMKSGSKIKFKLRKRESANIIRKWQRRK